MDLLKQFGFRAIPSEQRLPSETRETKSAQEIMKRGRRLSEYVGAIEKAQRDFIGEKERKRKMPFFNDATLNKGTRAATLALAGAGAAGSSFLKREDLGFWGHSIAAAGIFFGLQLFGQKGMESVQYFLKTPRAKVDAWRKKKGMPLREDDISEQEKVSEHSLRGKMLSLQLETHALYSDISYGVQEYKGEKERIMEKAQDNLQPQSEHELQYEQQRFLRKRVYYIDKLLEQYTELLETMRAYRDLAHMHEEKRQWAPLGIASVAAFLAGVHATADIDLKSLHATGEKITRLFSTLFPSLQSGKPVFDFRTESSLAPTMMAIITGWVWKYRDLAPGRERTRRSQETLEKIEEGIQGVMKYRGGLTRRLTRLRQNLGLEITDQIEQSLSGALPPQKNMAQEEWERRFDERINALFSQQYATGHISSILVEPQESVRFMPIPDELRMTASQEGTASKHPAEINNAENIAETAPIRAQPKIGLRAIKPLPPEQIIHSRKQTVVKQVIADVLRIAGKEFDIKTQKLVEQMPLQDVLNTVIPSTFNTITQDASVSEEALDEVVRYLKDLDFNMTGSVADFVFPREDDIASLRDVKSIVSHLDRGRKLREALEKVRAEEMRNVLKESPEALRRFFINRYHIIDLAADENVTQGFFEEHVRIWMRTATRHDRTSMRQFTDICSQELTALAVPLKREKSECISRIIRILDSHDTENPFIDALKFSSVEQESRTDMRRRALVPIADAFRELSAHPSFNKEMKIQEIVLGEWSKKREKLGMQQDREMGYKTRYTSGASFFEASYSEYPNPMIDHGMKKVDSQYIIGSLAHGRDVWIPESQQSDVIRLIRPLIESTTPEAFDDFFFNLDGSEKIELVKFIGPHTGRKSSAADEPERPIYFVRKGIECVAAARVLGIPVVARVKEMRPPSFIDPIYPSTLSGERHAVWHALTNGKLLESDSTGDFNIKNGQPTVITIKQTVLSWLPYFSFHAIAQINQQYDALYPESLDNLQMLDRKPIMKNALFTPQTLRTLLRRSG